jgi:hypothetical protein
MDNNMIRIDDLVRQRLRGGEEPERPGAWITMRELLDKEMPVSSGYNWRRAAGYFTALLLLITVSVGGYKLYNSHSASSSLASGGGAKESDVAYNATGIASEKSVPENNNTTSSANLVAPDNTASVNQGRSNTADNRGTSSHKSVLGMPAMIAGTQTHHTSKSGHIAKHAQPAQDVTAPDKADNTQAVATHTGTEPASTNDNSGRQRVKHQPADTRFYASSAFTVHGKRNMRHANEQRAGSNDVAALHQLPNAAQKANNISRQPSVMILHDSIERLEVVYRRVYDAGTDRFYYRVDTFPAGKAARDLMVAAMMQDQAAAASKPVHHRRMFGRRSRTSSASAIAANDAGAGSASDIKQDVAEKSNPNASGALSANNDNASKDNNNALNAASGSSSHFHLFDMSKMLEAINKMKSDVASIQLYPGIMMGINASMFTPNALGGFQAGLTSLIVLNDWWSLMLEPKYIIRFNTGSSLRDDYKQVIDNSGSVVPDPQYPGYMYYTWTDKTIQHNFNYDVVKTLEIPVMLRYHWGPVYAQSGANFVFSSPIKAKEVIQSLNDHKTHGESRPGTTVEPFITNDHPNIQMSDFGNRFGIGYVLSGGYMFNPKVYVDARLTQTVWDNSKTDGAKRVSKDLLRTPSIQLSVGIRFGKH